jgi:hypothetical protein
VSAHKGLFNTQTFYEVLGRFELLFPSFLHRYSRKFFFNIQNPHDQSVLAILVLALYIYPNPSNHHLKLKKISKEVLPVSGARELPTYCFRVFKH